MKKLSELYWALLLVVVTGCASVPTAPKNGSSAHFEETSAHLHLGGTVYTYVDIDGDLEKGTALLDEVIQSTGKIPDSIKAKIDTSKWAAMFGLDRIDAVGLSSYAQEDRYVNRAFIHYTEERAGILKVGGGEPHPFEVLALAPADSAMVFETDVNLSVPANVVPAVVRDIFGEYAAAALLSKLQMLIMPTDIEITELIEKLDTKVMGMIRIDEDNHIRMPKAELTLPVIDFMLAVDDFGFLFDSIAELAAETPLFSHDIHEDYESIKIQDKFPGDFNIYKPILRKDKKTGRVYFAGRSSYLKACLAQKTSIQDTEDFIKATEGLPIAAGNAVTYASPEFHDTLREILYSTLEHASNASVLKGDNDMAWLLPIMEECFPNTSVGQASVRVNYDNGTLFASNAAYSHKTTLLAAMAVNPVTIGMLSALAIPRILMASMH